MDRKGRQVGRSDQVWVLHGVGSAGPDSLGRCLVGERAQDAASGQHTSIWAQSWLVPDVSPVQAGQQRCGSYGQCPLLLPQ